jgi:hypothetical protein
VPLEQVVKDSVVEEPANRNLVVDPAAGAVTVIMQPGAAVKEWADPSPTTELTEMLQPLRPKVAVGAPGSATVNRIEPATVEEVTERGSQGLVTWLLFELPLYVAYQ